jgi:uncharacterized membrane protein YccC
LRDAFRAILYSLAGIALIGALYLLLFLAPTGIQWLACLIAIFAFGVWVGRQTMKR